MVGQKTLSCGCIVEVIKDPEYANTRYKDEFGFEHFEFVRIKKCKKAKGKTCAF